MLATIIGWTIAGLIVGGLARFLVPGKQQMSVPMTILLGIVGALVGGFIGSLVFGPRLVTDGVDTYSVSTAWPGWILAVAGGALVLWLVLMVTGNKDTKRLS